MHPQKISQTDSTLVTQIIQSNAGISQVEGLLILTSRCTRSFTGHTDCVNQIIIYESLIISASKDGSIKVWSAASGNLLRTLQNPLNVNVTSILAVNGKLFSGSDDGIILAWDAEKVSYAVVCEGLEGSVTSLNSINHDVLICGTSSGHVKMFTTGDEGTLSSFANTISKSVISTRFTATNTLNRSKIDISSLFGGDNYALNDSKNLPNNVNYEFNDLKSLSDDDTKKSSNDPELNPSKDSDVFSSPTNKLRNKIIGEVAAKSAVSERPSVFSDVSILEEELAKSEEAVSKHKRINSRLKAKVSMTLSELNNAKVYINTDFNQRLNLNLFESNSIL